MVRDSNKRAFVVNAFLVSCADGVVSQEEEKWIRAFISRAGVNEKDADRWLIEVKGGALQWLPIDDPDDAEAMIKLATGVIAADGKLDPREKDALFQLGKTLGIEGTRLQELFTAAWGKNVIDEMFARPASAGSPRAGLILVTDDFAGAEAFAKTAPHLTFETRSFADLEKKPGSPEWVIMHASPDREVTERRVQRLKQITPRAHLLGVALRHQAPQVAGMLGKGASICLVEPCLPGEIDRSMREATQD